MLRSSDEDGSGRGQSGHGVGARRGVYREPLRGACPAILRSAQNDRREAQHDRPAFFINLLVFVLGVTLFAFSGRAIAQEPVAPVKAQPVHILAGKSAVINVEARLKRILVSNPAVIEALATTPTQVVLNAKAAGSSSLILWDETGKCRMFNVTVDLDVSGLRTAIAQAYPDEPITVEADGGRLILSGSIPDQHTEDDLLKMAGAYSKEVVDSLDQVAPPVREILLDVKIAEVDRTKLNQLGFNILSTGAGNTPGVISTQQFGAVTGAGGASAEVTGTIGGAVTGTSTTFGLTDLLNIFLYRPDINLGALIKALEQKNILQILAAPNLLALSGEKASFLAGGEFPFPVVQGGQNIGVVTIEFRPFGVHLDFTGYVEDDNMIRLKVAPEVSTLDFTNSLTISGFTVPAISTRRAETVVELRNGQSFGIAGLLDQRETAQLSKIPGIGSVPVLGKLFQSQSIQTSRTELIVLVTPHIVDPRTGATTSAVPNPSMPYLNSRKFDKNLPGRNEVKKQSK